MLRSINDTKTEIAIKAERSYMKTIGGGCKFPLAAYATVENSEVTLNVMIGNHNTGQIINFTDKSSIENAEKLGFELAQKIEAEANKAGLVIER